MKPNTYSASLGTQKSFSTVFLVSFLSLGVLSGVGCGKPSRGNQSLNETGSESSATKEIVCSDLQSAVWKSTRKLITQAELTPTPEQFTLALSKELQAIYSMPMNAGALEKAGQAIYEIYEIIKKDSKTNAARSKQEMNMILAGLDVGNVSNKAVAAEMKRTHAKVIELFALISEISPRCQGDLVKDPFSQLASSNQSVDQGVKSSESNAQVESDDDDDEQSAEVASKMDATVASSKKDLVLANPQNQIEKGIQLTFATAYQSCDVLKMKPMSATTAPAVGVSVTGYYNGTKKKIRRITDLGDLLRTHYYLKNLTVNSDYSCVDVKRSPLIYNYGGKPAFHWGNEKLMTLFQNAGGGPSLGVDCSGFVFTAFATSGLRLKRNRPLVASDSVAWQSGSYVRPQENGLTCLQPIKMSSDNNLKVGDTIAINGHVVLVASLGDDPMGSSDARSASDCDKITAKDLDFNIAQSSPSKGSVGINISKASDFFSSGSMKAGIEEYARRLCKAKFQTVPTAYPLRGLTIARHLMTADCKDERVKLDHEECVQSCFAKGI
jgi:hypothetical protein